MQTTNNIGELTKNIKEYGYTQYEFIRLSVILRVSAIAADLVSNILVVCLFFLFLLFISLGLGFYISTLMGSYFYGFSIIAAFYLLVGLIVIWKKETLILPSLRDKLVQELQAGND